MEVIYTGLRQTPEMVVNAALQEDVDVIGVSILSGAHNTVFPKIIQLMKDKGLNDVPLTGGGIIPDADMKKLMNLGVAGCFRPVPTPMSSSITSATKSTLVAEADPSRFSCLSSSSSLVPRPISMKTYTNILLHIENGILTISVNRPDKLNALNKETIQEIGDAVKTAERDPAIAGIILTGVGPGIYRRCRHLRIFFPQHRTGSGPECCRT